jgi:hypothetical protein
MKSNCREVVSQRGAPGMRLVNSWRAASRFEYVASSLANRDDLRKPRNLMLLSASLCGLTGMLHSSQMGWQEA